MSQTVNDCLLRVDNLHIAFSEAGQGNTTEPADITTVVHGADFTLKRGRVLGIVGESGSGKSLTAKAVMGLLPAGAKVLSGSVLFDGHELPIDDEEVMRTIRGQRIAMLFQDPLSSFNPLHRIGRQIGEGLSIHREWSREQIRQRVTDLLCSVGIEDPKRIMNSFPHQLSGGQRQRAMLAMALADEPDILIADEPTTALDAAVQRQVVDLLLSVRQSISLIIISHDLPMMRSLADDLCVMQNGYVVESGSADSIFSSPEHPYTKMLMDSGEKEEPLSLPEEAEEILTVKSLNVRYPIGSGWFGKPRNYHHAVRDVSFRLRRGECLGIVGESGSGKSSLGLAVLQLIASEGNVSLMGQSLQSLSEKALRTYRSKLQIVFQDSLAALNPRLSVQECIAEGLRAQGTFSEKEIETRAIEAMRDVELDPDMRHRYPHEFSGGQCQRICLARALVMQPQCIVFDEPTSSLDRNTQFQVVQLVKKLQERLGLACLFIAHDLSLVRRICHRVLVMQGGDVVETGETENVFAAPRHEYTRRLLEAAMPAGVVRLEENANEYENNVA